MAANASRVAHSGLSDGIGCLGAMKELYQAWRNMGAFVEVVDVAYQNAHIFKGAASKSDFKKNPPPKGGGFFL